MTNIILIAPNAPPKNTAEAIQVRRILVELDKVATGKLITVPPAASGSWSQKDSSLEISLKNFDTHNLTLPFHSFVMRFLSSRYMARFNVPDSFSWIRWMAWRVLTNKKPDVIYSRSSPMSAALLAAKLKQRLGVPWIMHMSDPWADSPYKTAHPSEVALEKKCFEQADLIALTTRGQAEFYQKKYPALAQKIFVSPNVMGDVEKIAPTKTQDDRLHIVFAGALYGIRSPRPLIDALNILRETKPEILKKLRIDFYGNAQEEAQELLRGAADVIQYHGAVSYAEATNAQQSADVVLTIEPDTGDVFSRCFLPSKVLDCLSLGKPILAITPEGSETANICEEGYGWAVAPAQTEALAARITALIEDCSITAKTPPERYVAKNVVADLILRMNGLL